MLIFLAGSIDAASGLNGLIVFTPALIITDGKPVDTTNFYALYLCRRAFQTFQMGYGSGMTWVLLAVPAALTVVIFRTSSRWVFYASDRGGER